MSLISDILDLVVSHIAAIIPEAEVDRAWVYRVDAKNVDSWPKANITVVFTDNIQSNATKGDQDTIVYAVIVVQAKIDLQKMNEFIDPLIAIMETLSGELSSPTLIANESLAIECRITEESNKVPLYDTDRILKRQEFLGMIPIELTAMTERT